MTNTTVEHVDRGRYILRCRYCGPLNDEKDKSLMEEFGRQHDKTCPGPQPR